MKHDFYQILNDAATFDMDLPGWDTSAATGMREFFAYLFVRKGSIQISSYPLVKKELLHLTICIYKSGSTIVW